jgi:peptide/nickel transport system permease protein
MALLVPGMPAARISLRAKLGGGRRLDRIVVTVVVLALLVAVFGPLVAPSSQTTTSNILDTMQAPSAHHWLGTDDQGRDIAWRIVAGARESLLSALLVVAGYSVIGAAIGTIAALGGKVVDEVLMRLTDAVMAIPTIIFALGFTAALGVGLRSAIIALIITAWPVTARMLRGEIRQTLAMPYVAGARVLGMSRWRLLLVHILPNSLDPLIVKWGADVGSTVLVITSLSFIGAGPQPPSPEWGAMVSEGANYITNAWWMALFPGLAIAVVAVAFALLADIIQERLAAGEVR